MKNSTKHAAGYVSVGAVSLIAGLTLAPERGPDVVLNNARTISVPGPTQYVPVVELRPVPVVVEAEPTPRPTDCVAVRWRD